ncbi:MAG: hypothetical protein WBI45_08620, partial [Defluviitoga tunisiensis]
ATSNVDSTILTQKFTDFYEKLDLVYKAIDEYLNVARNFADNVSTTNYTEINGGTIKTGTITADKIVVEGRNFIIKDLQITPTKNKIEWTTFTLQELAEDTTYTVERSASSTYTTATYYLIVRINKNDPNNMNSQNILYTSSTLDKGQIGDFTYYPLGTVKFITNEIPIVSIDKGFTKIHGDYIQTGTITADKINVTQLSAITSDVGVLHAGDYVDIGDGVLPDGSDGIYIENGKIMVKNPDGTVVIDGTKNMLKILVRGTATIKVDNKVTIYFEDLGYRPIFLFYVSASDGSAAFPYYDSFQFYGEIIPTGVKGQAYTNKITIDNYFSQSVSVSYYIFEEVAW